MSSAGITQWGLNPSKYPYRETEKEKMAKRRRQEKSQAETGAILPQPRDGWSPGKLDKEKKYSPVEP